MEVPVRRMRQINEVIAERRSIREATEKSLIEWQTKVLASFFATNAQSRKAAEQITEAANNISIDGKKKGGQEPPTTDHLPPDDSPNAAANAARNAARANGSDGGPAAGSFEKMAAMFGGGGFMRAGPQGG